MRLNTSRSITYVYIYIYMSHYVELCIYIYKLHCIQFLFLIRSAMRSSILRVLQANTICYMVCKENKAKEEKDTTTKSASSTGKDCQINICCAHAVDHFLGNPVVDYKKHIINWKGLPN